MGKFLKEKDNEINSNPVFDLRFWTLLDDIISTPDLMGLGAHTRPLKTWLTPLLSHVPLAPSLVVLLRLLGDLDPKTRGSLTPVVFVCLKVAWPLSVQKLNTEAVLECFDAYLSAYRTSTEANADLVYLAFLQSVLPKWLELVTLPSSDAVLSGTIYDAGIETLFNLDVLRRARDSRTENDFFEAMAPVLTSNVTVYAVLPRLFASFIEYIKKNRGTLVQSSTPGTSSAEIQTQGMQFLTSCLLLLDFHDNLDQTWSARVGLLKVVEQESLFDRSNTEASALLEHIIGRTLLVFDNNECAKLAIFGIETLSTIARIDYDMLVPLLPQILQKLLLVCLFSGLTGSQLIQKHKVPGSNALYLQFLDLILEYHSKTRTMNSYTHDLFSALSTVSFHHSPINVYTSTFSSPLLHSTHLRRLSAALKTFLSESQVLLHTKSTFAFLAEEWEKLDVTELDVQERLPKRRKTTRESENPANAGHRSAVVFSVSCHLAMTVFSSLPMQAVTKEVGNELRELLDGIRNFAQRIAKKSMKALKKSGTDAKWEFSIIAAASLRLWYALDISGNLSIAHFDDDRLWKRALEAIQDGQLLPELFLELVSRC
ncbi:hypothetical protein H0H87_005876 [Tephrocybe sp. NHM501043]|nr:hypothetical protein H0H87_005876 [Tephrocybe sp. NHM501043]